MPPPPIEYGEDVCSEWEVESVVPSHTSIEHVERFTWRAPLSRFDFNYESFSGVATSTSPPPEDEPWIYTSLPSDDSDWGESAQDLPFDDDVSA